MLFFAMQLLAGAEKYYYSFVTHNTGKLKTFTVLCHRL